MSVLSPKAAPAIDVAALATALAAALVPALTAALAPVTPAAAPAAATVKAPSLTLAERREAAMGGRCTCGQTFATANGAAFHFAKRGEGHAAA